MNYPDLHMHSTFSKDGKSSVKEMVEAQKKNGTKICAITDHADFVHSDKQDCCAPIYESVREAEKLSGFRIKVLRGVEVSDAIWFPEEAEKLLRDKKFDLVLASVHHVDFQGSKLSHRLRDFKTFSREELREYVSEYFRMIENLVDEYPCQVVAHLTLPLRYIVGRDQIDFSMDEYKEDIQRILRKMIDKKIALEVNTSCYKDLGIFLPDEEILKTYRELGGDMITLGSDAHKAEDVSRDFGEAVKLLKKLGFQKVTYFVKQKPKFVKI